MALTYFDTQDILLPYEYISKSKGKRIRDLLLNSFNKWFELDDVNLSKIKNIIETLHNSSLIIDDIEDNSELRRGSPTAHIIYGIPLSLNAGNMMYFKGLEQILDFGKPEMVEVYCKCMMELHRGQGKDIYWRDQHLFTNTTSTSTSTTLGIPTEEDYTHMVSDKTGGLFKLAFGLISSLRSTEVHSSLIRDLNDLVSLIGLLYQIRDDYLNLTSDEYATSKSYCEDFSEGKISFIIITSAKSNSKIIDLLRERPKDLISKKILFELIKSTGALEYTKSHIEKLKGLIVQKIDELGGNITLKELISKL